MPFALLGLLLVGLGVGAWVSLHLIRQQGRILLRVRALEAQVGSPVRSAEPLPPSGLTVGTPAPAFALPDLEGETVTLDSLRGKRLLLIFFNPDCGFCARMAGELAALPVDGDGGRPIPVLITAGDAHLLRHWFAARSIRSPVLVQRGNEIATLYRAGGTPVGYLIDAGGRIASDLAIGADALLKLSGADLKGKVHPSMGPVTRSLAESRIERNGLAPGTPAPDFCLPDLDGTLICMRQFRGQRVLLLFSDVHCGPCDELARRIGAQGGTLSGGEILMVSRGEPEVNRAKATAYRLSFPILLQKQWEISRLYGRFGTPIGYLINEDGLIDAKVASGVAEIMALLSHERARGT